VRELTRIVIGTAAAALAALSAAPFAQAVAQTLEPRPVFEGTVTAPVKNGAAQPANISVQSWELPNQEGAAHEIPLRGFYVAHLLSGDISTTVDGQTAAHVPGDYWTVKPGATMQVKVLSELAVLETIVATKP
jgi:quercetin dioxygenase-like cupin family protein